MGPTLSSALQPGQTFGRYQIVRTIGVGSFGIVYEAVQYPLGRRVALKLLHDRTLTHPDALARFEREAMAAARLQHPHVVDVFDYGAHEGTAFLAMEYLEGESLQALMRRAGPLPVETLVDLMLPVISAVAAVHDAGVVHRDLKPENVLLTVNADNEWHPKLLDFGIAKVDTQGMELTRTNALLGTPCYMSPEQVMQARSIDGRADQWSLGVIMYEAIAGRKPFFHETLLVLMTAITSEDAHPLSAFRSDLHPAFEAVVMRMMMRRPEDRYATMRDVGAALLPFASAAAQHRWYAEFIERQYAQAPATTSRGQLPGVSADPAATLASFSSPDEDDATRARQPSLNPHDALRDSRPVADEPTELVNTTSQDGEFPAGFVASQPIHHSGAMAAAPPGAYGVTASQPGAHAMSGGFPQAPPDYVPEEPAVGTGTLAMDIDAIGVPQQPYARQPTGRMPPYKSTVEMNQPVAPGPVGVHGSQPGYPMAPVGPQGSYGPMPGMRTDTVLGMPPQGPVGTFNLTSGEVSRPSAQPSTGKGRTALLALLVASLGVVAFVFVFVWSKGSHRGSGTDTPRVTTRPVADAAVSTLAAPDVAVALPSQPDVVVAEAPDVAVALPAAQDAAVAALEDVTPTVEGPDAAVAMAVDAAAAAAPDVSSASAHVRVRPDAGRVGGGGGRGPRGPHGPRSNAPIF